MSNYTSTFSKFLGELRDGEITPDDFRSKVGSLVKSAIEDSLPKPGEIWLADNSEGVTHAFMATRVAGYKDEIRLYRLVDDSTHAPLSWWQENKYDKYKNFRKIHSAMRFNA